MQFHFLILLIQFVYEKFYSDLAEYVKGVGLTQGLNEVHHYMMIFYEDIINKMAKTLFDLFDGQSHGLTIDHFKMNAANGLFPAMQNNASSDPNFYNLHEQFKSKYAPLQQILVSKNLSFGCN